MNFEVKSTSHSIEYSPNTTMDQTPDKEQRKREYNRLAQREFRRRRKEHLKSLEQAQKLQSSEKAEEIERLRSLNNDLRKENSVLRAQIYGTPSSQIISADPINHNRQYPLSPSILSTSMSSTGSSLVNMAGSSEFMPVGNISLSSSMMVPAIQSYTEHELPAPPYSLVHYPGIRHSAQSSPESSGFRSSCPELGSSFQTVKIEETATSNSTPRQNSNMPTMTVLSTYDENKARTELFELFKPLLSDSSVITDPQKHLTTLRSIAATLPGPLKPTKSQLELPHYHGIDLVVSPSLRDRLLTMVPEAARNLVNDLGIIEKNNNKAVIIWGDDPLNEISWELSREIIERWGWVLGNEWIQRSNFWRKQRGAPSLPEW